MAFPVERTYAGCWWISTCFFFFSSRRLHTRCYRDWSSDVCSSDLVELRTQLGGEPNHCGERFSDSAAETRQRAHRALGDQSFNLLGGELAARHHFPDRKIAFPALELAIVFLHCTAALRTRSLQGAEHGIGYVPALDAGNHFPGEIDDVLHELAARQSPMLHLFQLEFPVTGELRGTQLVDAEMAQREKQ